MPVCLAMARRNNNDEAGLPEAMAEVSTVLISRLREAGNERDAHILETDHLPDGGNKARRNKEHKEPHDDGDKERKQEDQERKEEPHDDGDKEPHDDGDSTDGMSREPENPFKRRRTVAHGGGCSCELCTNLGLLASAVAAVERISGRLQTLCRNYRAPPSPSFTPVPEAAPFTPVPADPFTPFMGA